MREGFFVSASFGNRKLCSALVQLRSHLDGFVRRTTEGYEQLRELFEFDGVHKKNADEARASSALQNEVAYFTESRGTILMLSTFMRFTGRSPGCVAVVPIFSNTSSPLMSLPNAVY